jgi:uncharacterized membrane protein YedE/YeeE
MHDFTPLRSLLGGMLLGLSASLLALGAGRVAGISGILGGLFTPGREGRGWRVQFLAGLGLGGVLLMVVHPAVFHSAGRSWPLLALAGLLVGFGARLGGGCTSGHGVCGLSRLSGRSLVATLVFMVTAMLTVLVIGP